MCSLHCALPSQHSLRLQFPCPSVCFCLSPQPVCEPQEGWAHLDTDIPRTGLGPVTTRGIHESKQASCGQFRRPGTASVRKPLGLRTPSQEQPSLPLAEARLATGSLPPRLEPSQTCREEGAGACSGLISSPPPRLGAFQLSRSWAKMQSAPPVTSPSCPQGAGRDGETERELVKSGSPSLTGAKGRWKALSLPGPRPSSGERQDHCEVALLYRAQPGMCLHVTYTQATGPDPSHPLRTRARGF